MKNTFRRLIAMVLLLGTIASFVVPATYADTEEVGAVVQTFDFELYNYDKFSGVIDGGFNKWSKAAVRNAVLNAYPADNNWIIEKYSEGIDYNKLLFIKNYNSFKMSMPESEWVAFRLNVEKDGNYGIVLNSAYKSAKFTAKTWLFPASEATMTVTEVENNMIANNAMSDVTIGSDTKAAPIGAARLSAGEYILVVGAEEAMDVYISNLQLIKVSADDVPDASTAAPVEDIVFDFELYNYDKFSGVIDGGFNKWSKAVVRNAVLNAYPADNNWIIEKYSDGVDYNKLQFIKNYTSFKMVIPANEWVAFRLNVDTAGNYQMVLTNLYKNAPEYAAKTWLIPVAAGVTKDTVADYMTSQYAGNDVNIEKAGEAEIFEGEFAVGEYILVVGTEKDADVYISNLRLVPITEEEEPTVESTTTGSTEGTTESTTEGTTEPSTEAPTEPSAVMQDNIFDFELYNYDYFKDVIPGDSNKWSKAAVRNRVKEAYPAINNWVIEAYGENVDYNKLVFYKARKGFRASEMEGKWIAFRLNVKNAGQYELVLNSLYASAQFTAKTWLFPAPAQTMTPEEVQSNMTDANAKNELSIGGERRATPVCTENFAAGEYILVIQSNKDEFFITNLELATPGQLEIPEIPAGPTGVKQENVFDFELYNFAAFGNTIDGENNKWTKATVRNAVKNAFTKENNWTIEAYADGVDTDSLQFISSQRGLRMTGVKDKWVAFRLDVDQGGKLELWLNSLHAYSYSAQTWVFPAPEKTLTAAEVETYMTDDNAAEDVKFGSKGGTALVCEKEFAAGQYILVMKAAGERMYISNLKLSARPVEVPKEPVDKMFYDFDLLSMDENFVDKGFTNWYDPDTKKVIVYEKVAQMYDEDIINWKYETISKGAKKFTFKPGNLRIKSGSNFLDLGETWNALRIEAPGAGTYDIRLTSADKSTTVADIYLIPARTGFAMKAEDIEANMTAENLLVAGALLSGKDTFYLGEYTFGTEYEYILVFKCTRGKVLYMNNMEITKDGLVADEEVKKLKAYDGVVYNFDLGDEFVGILQPYGKYRYDSNGQLKGGAPVFDQMNAAWANGKLNWKWEMASDDLINLDENLVAVPNEYIRFYQENGMYVYGAKDSWVAFRIKSPGSGDFTLTMNHAVCPDSAVVAVYIIPADTPQNEIWQATDPANRIGKVVLTNEDGSAGKEDGHESFIGYYNFEAGKEYILVLEAYAASGFNNLRANMNISNIVMKKGIVKYNAEETKTVKPVTVSPNILNVQDSGQGCTAVWEANGMDYYAVHLEGGGFYVYNLDTQELVDEQYWNTTRPRNMVIAPDGKIWIIATWKYVICYDPVTKTFEKTAAFMPDYKYNGFNYGTITEDGTLYLTQHLSGHLIKYDPQTKKYTDLGIIYPGANSCDALVYREGYLYVNCGYTGEFNSVVKYNIATNQVEGAYNYIDLAGDSNAYAMTLLGNEYVAVGVSTNFNECAITVDMKTMELVDLGLPGAISRGVTEEIDGKQYIIVTNYGLYEYDVATREVSKVTGFESMSGSGFRSGGVYSYGKSWVTLNGDFCLISNTAQVRCCPRIINMDKREYYEWTDLTRDVLGGGTDIISFTNGAENSGELIMGFYNALHTATYNIHTGEITSINVSAGQTDSILWYKDILYAGCYSATVLVEIDRQRDEMLQRFKLDHETTGQKRLLNMTAGDDRVFVGSIPETGVVGGAITTYNTLTGQWHMHRNVVQDQSIIDMVHHDGVLFGASSRKNGDNTELSGDSAVIIAYDYVNYEVLATLDPRDFIPGLKSPVHFVYGLGVDPNADENGRIWGMVAEVLFCFTYDKETRTFDAQVVKDFGHTSYNSSSGVDRHQNQTKFIYENGQIIAMFKTAGIYAFTLEDWDAPVGKVQVATSQRLMGYRPEDFIIGEDNNLYFANGGNLMMLPMNVTDEDWAIAEDIDQQIANLGKITLESEAAVKSARSAYDNTSWYYRALVQKVELLREAESDLLECQIQEALGCMAEVTADDYPALQELVDVYKGFDKRQQRYVKNYADLKTAYEEASDLYDARCAAAVQEKVDALQELFPIESLEKEPAVVAVRTEFDALPGRQRILVDTTILEEAEAQIAVLRAELVKQVEALIQAIPDEITLDAETAITAAREGVDKLYALERKQVSYSKLETAEAKLRNLKNAVAKAEEVDALIKSIGIVTLGDAARIAAARQAYNALNETARSFVTKYSKLRRAEFILAGLQTWMIPTFVVVGAGVAFAVVWFVPSLHNKVFKGKKKEEEPAEN